MNHIKDAVRQINANLAMTDQKSNVLVFTTPNEAQSQHTVIANLAMMYSESGKSILILDTDFKSTVFADTFKIHSKGLSDYLDGAQVTYQDITSKISNTSVSLIPSGNIGLDSTRYLLGDPKFNALLEKVRVDYDMIFINTPEFNVHTNEFDNLKNSDGLVIVVNMKGTLKKQLLAIINAAEKSKMKILGYISAN